MAMFKTCQRPTVTDSAVSGAVCNFNTILNVPLKSHEVAIVATQSGSGTPSPTNIRPITVYSQAVISQSGADTSTPTTNTIPFGQTVAGGVLDVISGEITVTHGYIASYNGETINEPWISSIDEYVAGTTPSTGAQVVYELATPTTIQLSPLQLSTLIGDNNIWADTGDTSLEYYDLPVARSGEFREVFKLPTSI